ncbi:MAG: hypothetical protein H6837_08310 [Planctomycetes bacterium]|nr:hypothetical protein [Planctomycetota bacterium]
MKVSHLAVVATALTTLLGTARAQLAADPQVIGWVSSPLLPASGGLQLQDIDNKCQPAKVLCTNVLLNTTIAYAGGTAYDPRHQTVWVTDGRSLEEFDPMSCKSVCQAKPALMRAGAVFSGLAIANRRRMLYHLETMPGYLGILPWNNAVCPPVPTKGGCGLTLGAQDTAGGLAYDETRDLLYFTISTPTTTGVANTLLVASANNACVPTCKLAIPGSILTVPFGAVTGLAFNPCDDSLYATDGRVTLRLQVDPVQCTIKLISTCAKQTGGGDYQGLALVPGWSRAAVGKSCVTKGCPSCPSLATTVFGGDPALGNPDFGIAVTGGPTGALAILAVGFGGCTPGSPFLCGALHLSPLTPIVLVPLGTMTGPQCAAEARIGVPVPVDAQLCGATLCLQSVALCGTATGDHALSAGLRLTLAH